MNLNGINSQLAGETLDKLRMGGGSGEWKCGEMEIDTISGMISN